MGIAHFFKNNSLKKLELTPGSDLLKIQHKIILSSHKAF